MQLLKANTKLREKLIVNILVSFSTKQMLFQWKFKKCTIFKSFCKQKTGGAQRGRILFTQTFEFTSSFHQNAQRISSLRSLENSL